MTRPVASLQAIILVVLMLLPWPAQGFSGGPLPRHTNNVQDTLLFLSQSNRSQQDLRDEAEALLSKARRLREEIGAITILNPQRDEKLTARKAVSPWSVENQETGDEYRLYVDIGREEGTWMDRRWGASGRRISFTIDCKFLTTSLASTDDAAKMVKDNYMGKSSATYAIATASAARLRGGFDKMNCGGGCYRIDSANNKDTVRFYLHVDGTSQNQDYGCVPAGKRYQTLTTHTSPIILCVRRPFFYSNAECFSS
jgi:hypothetical protein